MTDINYFHTKKNVFVLIFIVFCFTFSLNMELFEAIALLIEAKPHITFLTQCICYICLTNLTTTSLINFDRPVGIRIFLHIHTRTFPHFSWRSWSRLFLFCRRPFSLWSSVHFNQSCCHLCLKISSYENGLLWNLKKGRVTPIQQPGVDHSHGNEIPEKSHVPSPRLHVILIFGKEAVQEVYTPHEAIVFFHSEGNLDLNMIFLSFIPSRHLTCWFWASVRRN